MSWNQELYTYLRAGEGRYFGPVEAGPGTACALMTGRGGPILLSARTQAGRGSCRVWGCARMAAELPRPFSLSLRRKNPMERTAAALTGQREGAQGEFERLIRVQGGEDDAARRVLQVAPLRQCLMETEGLCLSICPAEEGGALHSVLAQLDWGMEAEGALSGLLLPEEGPMDPAGALDALCIGAQALYDAVTAWVR